MIGFHYRQSELTCDGTPIAALAAGAGTPLYVYSAAALRARVDAFADAFAGMPHSLHYALKANSNLSLLTLLRGLGCRADANSIGEIEVARRAGFLPEEIVFSGVGKTGAELERAVELRLLSINAESAGEIDRLDALGRARGRAVRISLRVNPDIDPGSHPHMSTGLGTTKFGIPLADAREVARSAARKPGVAVVGLHVHIGSQITSLDPIRCAVREVVALAGALESDGITLDHLDVGGGLGVPYDGRPAPSVADYAAAIRAIVPAGRRLILEPGRALIATAGVLVTRVVDVKPRGAGRWFVVVDAGMTELLRPALYDAFHRIEPVVRNDGPTASCEIVGPLCEVGDTLGHDRRLPVPSVGDLLAVFDVGAYGFTMASNYNRRPLPAEALVDDDDWRVIRRRQTLDEMIAAETGV